MIMCYLKICQVQKVENKVTLSTATIGVQKDDCVCICVCGSSSEAGGRFILVSKTLLVRPYFTPW